MAVDADRVDLGIPISRTLSIGKGAPEHSIRGERGCPGPPARGHYLPSDRDPAEQRLLSGIGSLAAVAGVSYLPQLMSFATRYVAISA